MVVLLAVVHLGIPGAAPVLDAAPAPAAHQHHLAAESEAGCQTWHADHCVLCRVLTGEAADGAPVADIPLPAPPSPERLHADGDAVPDRTAHSPSLARAPPAA